MYNNIAHYFRTIRFRNNIYTALAFNLVLVMLVFTLGRLLFFWLNRGYFGEVGTDRLLTFLLGGLKFDLSAVLYTNLLYVVFMLLPVTFRYGNVYQNIAKWIFWIFNSVAILANSADIVYFRFTLRRTTASLFAEFENETNIVPLLLKFSVDYWYVILIWLALTALLVVLYRKPKAFFETRGLVQHATYSASGLVVMALCMGLVVSGLRGGFRHSTRPITLSNAGEFVKEPLETAIVLNTPFSIYRTIGVKGLERVSYYPSEEQLSALYSPVHQFEPKEPFRHMNIVIIIMESVGREYIGAYNRHLSEQGYRGFTPFLDSLIDQSFKFQHSFSNGRKSIDVLPSVLTSIPMMVEPFVLTPYSANNLNSIATLLKPHGYTSAFFHGAPNGSMGHQAFTTMHGFDKYFGMNEYGNSKDFDGMWGIWDEEFFQFFAQKLKELPQPFCAGIFSVTSHHPFKIPPRYEGVFPKGHLPIHQCIGYTDYALRRFYNAIKNEPWFDNTLFVFTADHPNEPWLEEYKNVLGGFSVPIFFHHPSGNLIGQSNTPAQHIDILPTTLSYLNFSKPFVAFGKNLFDEASVPIAISYSNSTYQLVFNKYLLLFDGQHSLGLYNYQTDPMLKQNIMSQEEQMTYKLEQMVKAVVQQYKNRLIDDRLQAEPKR